MLSGGGGEYIHLDVIRPEDYATLIVRERDHGGRGRGRGYGYKGDVAVGRYRRRDTTNVIFLTNNLLLTQWVLPFSPGDVILKAGGGPHTNSAISVSPESLGARSPS